MSDEKPDWKEKAPVKIEIAPPDIDTNGIICMVCEGPADGIAIMSRDGNHNIGLCGKHMVLAFKRLVNTVCDAGIFGDDDIE